MYDRLEKQALDGLLENYNKRRALLETGCGTGHWSKYFSAKGFEVTGIDTSKQMIKKACEKNIAHCRFRIADGQNLPFVDNSFDIAAAITTLEFADNPERIVSEMSRCVKSGGRLLFGVLNALSASNRKRKKTEKSVLAYARLFSPAQLESLLGQFGDVRTKVTGFVVPNKWFIWLSPWWDRIRRFTGSKKGAFIIAEVKL